MEIPAVAFRKILNFVGTNDMPNIHEAVMISPTLINEFNHHTKRYTRDFTDANLLCPYCLVADGSSSPWRRVQDLLFEHNHWTQKEASASLEMWRNETHKFIKSHDILGIQTKLNGLGGVRVNNAARSNFLSLVNYWSTTGLANGKIRSILNLALKNMETFDSVKSLFNHIENTHHPKGCGWLKSRTPLRAYEFDSLSDLIMAKTIPTLGVPSAKDNIPLLKAFREGIVRNKLKRSREESIILRISTCENLFDYRDTGHVQDYHRTLALSFQFEDNLVWPTIKHKILPRRLHKILALRDYLHCKCEVFENINYRELTPVTVTRFGMYNAVRIILNEILKLPY